ncbi:ASCH domain-containing protein (plasmid) [Enterobacter ludwigii]
MNLVDALKAKYPGSQAWQIGDNADMANELADLVMKGIKTASCGSLASYLAEKSPPRIGSHNIILDGRDEPVCVIRMTSMRLVRFSDVTEELARKEGEGDLSLEYWRSEHKAFFTRAGFYADDMELVAEEFEVVEVCNRTDHA